MAVSPGRHRGLDLHLEPEPDPVRLGDRVCGRAARRAQPARALVAAVRASGRWSSCSATCWASSSSRRSSSRGWSTFEGGGAAASASDLRWARASAASRSSPRATCRSSPTSSGTTSPRRARSSATSRVAAAAPRAARSRASGSSASGRSRGRARACSPIDPLLAFATVMIAVGLGRRRGRRRAPAGPARRGVAGGVDRLGDRRARAVRAEPRGHHPGPPERPLPLVPRPARARAGRRGAGVRRARLGVAARRATASPRGVSRRRAAPWRRASGSCWSRSPSVAWPPATSPDGGWRLVAQAAGSHGRVARTGDRPRRARRHPAVQERQRDALPARARRDLGPGRAGRGSASNIVIVCDPLFDDVVGAACGGPAEDAWIAANAPGRDARRPLRRRRPPRDLGLRGRRRSREYAYAVLRRRRYPRPTVPSANDVRMRSTHQAGAQERGSGPNQAGAGPRNPAR